MKGSTPLMRQYYAIKEQYPGAVLFFRMGDFYETFGDDAKITAEVLDITLTTRGRDNGKDIPLAGIPYHALNTYLHKMVKAGYKVAICEQVEDPKKAKGIVKREVVRLVSPGTVVEDSMLSGKSNNFLASVSGGGSCVGLAFIDISTGEFFTTQLEGGDLDNKLRNELARFQPSECIVNPGFGREKILEMLGTDNDYPLTELEEHFFDQDEAKGKILDLFKVKSLAGYGCEEKKLAVSAAGAAIAYLENMQMCELGQISTLNTYSTSEFMVLDQITLRNLEIFQNIRDRSEKNTMFELLDRTLTPMGTRLLRKWLAQPLLDVKKINERLDSVEWLANNRLLRSELREYAESIRDLERLIARVVHGSANGRDMLALKQSLTMVPQIIGLIGNEKSPALVGKAVGSLDPMEDLVGRIDKAIVDKPPLSLKDGGLINRGYSSELDELKDMASSGERWIADLESKEKKRTGIKSLKIKYNRVFGYFIEVTNTYQDRVPEDYIRKQTLSNAERFITPELKEKEAQILTANERLEAMEYELFCELRQEVAENSLAIQGTARSIGLLDTLASLAEIAELNRYSRPLVDASSSIRILEGRHPVVEQMIDERFVPNDTMMDAKKSRVVILTGPNMAGKSTYMRQTALIMIMAQVGSFIPAKEASIGLVDRIFTRVGAYDDLTHGQSTFMVEMTEVANILNSATKRSLILLDEIGRGTSTFDGLSIAWAVVEYIQSKKVGAKTIFATHYHHLTELEELLDGVANYNIAVKEEKDNIIFLRKVIPGSTNRSYGVQVGKLAGLPMEVVNRAKEILSRIEDEAVMELEDGKKRKGKRRTYTQLVLYDQMGLSEADPIHEELKDLDPDHMTPIEALKKLHELKRKVEEK